jgi:hypothetical protein
MKAMDDQRGDEPTNHLNEWFGSEGLYLIKKV